jgi:predicted transcriptional regulator
MTEKTTVYLDTADQRRLRALAAAQGRSTAQLIREAMAEYIERHAPLRRPASIGAARSGMRDLAERAEELLQGFGES